MDAKPNSVTEHHSNASSYNTAYRALWNGKQAQDAQTPPAMRAMLDKLYFGGGAPVFDPCPVNPTFDGLQIAWRPRNYVNPPLATCSSGSRKPPVK